jgi:hypothetical protein
MSQKDRVWLSHMEKNQEHKSSGSYVGRIRDIRCQQEKEDDSKDDGQDNGDGIESSEDDEGEDGLKLVLQVSTDMHYFQPARKALDYAEGALVADLKQAKEPGKPCAWMCDRNIILGKDGIRAAENQGDESRLLRLYKPTLRPSDLYNYLGAKVSGLMISKFLDLRLLTGTQNSNLGTSHYLTPPGG